MDAAGCRLTQVDAGGHRRTHVDAGGHRWTKADIVRCRWTKVETTGSRWTKHFYSFSISMCEVGLYNLNDSVDLKDQLLSLSYLLKIFEMSLNYFWEYFSPITMIFFYISDFALFCFRF